MNLGTGKAQIIMLAPLDLVDRLDALRIVMNKGEAEGGMNRSRVLMEAAVNGPVSRLESQHHARLNRLNRVAGDRGMTLSELVRDYAERHQRKTYAPTLEQLEAGHV